MKKTLIALFALAGMVHAEGLAFTLETDFTKGSTAGNNYSGLTFTVQQDSDRYIMTPELQLTDVVYLNSIVMQFRNDGGTNKIADGLAMAITDTNHLVLGVSTTSTTFQEMSLIGQENMVNMVDVSFDTAVQLNVGTQYFAYYVTGAKAADLTVGETTLTSTDLASVNLMARGQGFSSPSSDFTFTAGLNATSTSFTPVGAMSFTAPEPATATLSLLALAGLASRRRRH